MTDSDELARLKLEELKLLEQRIALQEMLPHRYGMPWYPWAHQFFTSTNKLNFLCAGNQVSKSSTQIRKCIEWATNKELWPKLWPNSLSTPNCFWYFYPSMSVASDEVELKWKQFLPKDPDHPVYGYKIVRKKSEVGEIRFKSGMTVFFKSYEQNLINLQTGTVYALFADEEMPVHLLPELMARLNAAEGYFHMVFTATIGQDHWKKTIEPEKDDELYPSALKIQVDLERGDCSYYMDGTPSPWTPQKIQDAINRCSSPQEKARRVNGKFVVEGGLRYSSFEKERNVTPKHSLPRDWLVFAGLDYGSGGENHPSAIIFVGVSPDYRKARVFKGKRFDFQITTADDVIRNYVSMKQGLNVVLASYDYSAIDMYTIASGLGISLQKADKSRERGTQVLNTLFKTGVLKIFDDDELAKLVAELLSLKTSVNKSDARDDFIDALRYAVMGVPWDWGYLEEIAKLDSAPADVDIMDVEPYTELDERRDFIFGRSQKRDYTPEDELAEWNSLINDELEFF